MKFKIFWRNVTKKVISASEADEAAEVIEVAEDFSGSEII